MAAIDNIYLKTKKEFTEFYEWCETFDEECMKELNLSILDYFCYHPYEVKEGEVEYIATIGTPFSVDKWLWLHCPLSFIRNYMSEYWGYSNRNKKKWMFYIDKVPFDREKFRQNKTLTSLSNELYDLRYCSSSKDKDIIKSVYNKIIEGKCRYNYVNILKNIGYNLIY